MQDEVKEERARSRDADGDNEVEEDVTPNGEAENTNSMNDLDSPDECESEVEGV